MLISSWIFARFNDVICAVWEWSELSPRSTGLQNNPAEKLNEFPTWQKNHFWEKLAEIVYSSFCRGFAFAIADIPLQGIKSSFM